MGGPENAEPAIDQEALEAARRAVEDVLIEHRDSGIIFMNNNGFVCRTKDGQPSDIIRLSTKMGLSIGIQVYLKALGAREPDPSS